MLFKKEIARWEKMASIIEAPAAKTFMTAFDYGDEISPVLPEDENILSNIAAAEGGIGKATIMISALER